MENRLPGNSEGFTILTDISTCSKEKNHGAETNSVLCLPIDGVASLSLDTLLHLALHPR
jgi:hypothetical protein